jgi:hypothetical protein
MLLEPQVFFRIPLERRRMLTRWPRRPRQQPAFRRIAAAGHHNLNS